MKKFYLTRLCNNKSGWKHPDGTASQQETQGSFCQENGFGHEEWLFRDDWLIKGWKYGFLQGVNDSLRRLRKDKEESINVLLYCVDVDTTGHKFTKAVAYIQNLQILSPGDIKKAKETVQQKGWLDQMINDLKHLKRNLPTQRVEINKLGDKEKVDDIINVRFQFKDVTILDISIDNIIDKEKIKHLKLFNLDEEILQKILIQNSIYVNDVINKHLTDENQLRSVESYIRKAMEEIEVQRKHNKIQNALLKYLNTTYNDKTKYKICIEKNRIDAYVESNNELILFEVKSYDTALKNIREAIGQLLEYSKINKPPHVNQSLILVIVGNVSITKKEQEYLDHLTEKYKLPIEYLEIK